MKPARLFLLLLFSAAIFSCNKVQTNESKHEPGYILTNRVAEEAATIDTVTTAATKDTVTSPAPAPGVKKVKKKKQAPVKKPEPAVSLADIFRQVAKAPEHFTFIPDRDTTFACKEGTKIKIKGRSFVSEKTGEETSCNLRFSVTEYYKLSDMLLANLSTTSGSEILETGGMIYIAASSDSENYVLKKGEEIEISFPTQERKDGMKLFFGKWKDENQIDWQHPETQAEPTYVDFAYLVDEMSYFRGGVSKMQPFIAENVIYPAAAKAKGLEGTVVLSFMVSETGKIQNVKVVRGMAPELDSAAVDVVRKMPDWVPAKQHGKNVSVRYRLFMNFIIDGNAGLVLYGYRGEDWHGQSMDVGSDSSIAHAGATSLSSYIFSTTKLGWINCDRFREQKKERINYTVSTGSSSNSNVKIIFHKFKGIMDGKRRGANYVFEQIPPGEDITIVAITYKGNQPFLCIRNTKTGKAGEKDLVFEQPLTSEVLKAAMKNLDRLN